ncbi:hypothetical protein M8494_27385 [Serratia ureilytica]
MADNMTQDNCSCRAFTVRRRCDAILPKVTLLFIGIALVLAGVAHTDVTTPLIGPRSPATVLPRGTLNASERIDERYIADAWKTQKP